MGSDGARPIKKHYSSRTFARSRSRACECELIAELPFHIVHSAFNLFCLATQLEYCHGSRIHPLTSLVALMYHLYPSVRGIKPGPFPTPLPISLGRQNTPLHEAYTLHHHFLLFHGMESINLLLHLRWCLFLLKDLTWQSEESQVHFRGSG